MKITKSQLKQIIREELSDLQEAGEGEKVMAAISDIPKAAEGIAMRVRKEVEGLAGPSGMDPEPLLTAVAALLSAG